MPQLLVDEYIELTNEYRKKYGEKTIIWMQTGSFYEVYAWNEEDEQIKVSQNILQIRITTKKVETTNHVLWQVFLIILIKDLKKDY